jgi:hypothetical protein
MLVAQCAPRFFPVDGVMIPWGCEAPRSALVDGNVDWAALVMPRKARVSNLGCAPGTSTELITRSAVVTSSSTLAGLMTVVTCPPRMSWTCSRAGFHRNLTRAYPNRDLTASAASDAAPRMTS